MNENNEVNTNVNDEAILDEEQKLNESEYFKALEVLNSYRLNWNFRSIKYILNTLNISMGQLRSCVYVKNGYPVFDYLESTVNLIKAGLIGSKQFSESDVEKLEDRAYEIIEEWADHGWFIGTLHLMIINQMETKHFFMDTQDLRVINHLNSKNLQSDLAINLIKSDIEERLKQNQAYTV